MFQTKKLQFFVDEGAALLVDPSRRGDGGTIFVQSATVQQPFIENPFAPGAPRRLQPWDKDAPKIVPQMVMAVEHYNRIVRMIQAGEKVKMAVNLAVEFQDKDPMAYNTVAEIPGVAGRRNVHQFRGPIRVERVGGGVEDHADRPGDLQICLQGRAVVAEDVAAHLDPLGSELARVALRSASVAAPQASSLPTCFSTGIVDRFASKSSKPNARSTDTSKTA